ncbi:hypothetical protein [Dokdonia sp.]|uniref:hypothetical protein n=1 Tax=Dokdonia sp. TaxID=2024995 RepID=UPI003267B737
MYDYIIYQFDIQEVQKTQDWIDTYGKKGYKIINIHYYDDLARYTLERARENDRPFHSNR